MKIGPHLSTNGSCERNSEIMLDNTLLVNQQCITKTEEQIQFYVS